MPLVLRTRRNLRVLSDVSGVLPLKLYLASPTPFFTTYGIRLLVHTPVPCTRTGSGSVEPGARKRPLLLNQQFS